MRQTWVQIDGKLVPKDEWRPRDSHEIIKEIDPYQSMVTGEMITSRAKHREHLKRHNCQEIGNEKLEAKPVKIVDPRRKGQIAEIVNHYDEDKIRDSARELGEYLKWNSRGRTL